MNNRNSFNAPALTAENYYSHETDWHYMSFSIFKDFEKCEAAALAKLKEDWQPTSNPMPLLVGNYIHSYFESEQAHEEWLNQVGPDGKTNRDQMMTKSGTLRANFKQADVMIKTLENDKLFNAAYMPGAKEVIVTGELFGHLWKGKIDSLSLEQGFFCDLKTVDDIHKAHWNPDKRLKTNFIEDRHYTMQMAIYKELIKQTFGKEVEPFIFAVSKQTPPDKGAFAFDGDTKFIMEDEMDEIKDYSERLFKVMAGELEPEHCGKCEYCRATKELTGFVNVTDIDVE